MQLPFVYDIPTNYHSRTRLPGYKHLPGGETTATMRLQSDSPGFKSTVIYPPAWITYVKVILNDNEKAKYGYLFRKDGGIQNSGVEGHMEQLTCEGNIVDVVRIDGHKAFLSVFHTNETPPSKWDGHDPRIQRITVVNLKDELTKSTRDEVYFPLMARPGEELWLDVKYLEPLFLPKPITEFNITIRNDKSTDLK